LLSEGKRLTDIIAVYAPIGLDFIAADPELQRSGDCIVWEEKRYEVIQAKKWNNGLISHWELIAEREKEGDA
jgi:hypothetical protein